MGWVEALSATLLLSGYTNEAPIHNYSYHYLDIDGSTKSDSGTHFFAPYFPEVSINGLTYFDNFGFNWQITTPFISDKYSRGASITAQIFYEYNISEMSKLIFSTTLVSNGRELIRPCYDNLNRQFHCFYGTQPDQPLYFAPFNEIQRSNYRKTRNLDVSEVGISWVMSF